MKYLYLIFITLLMSCTQNFKETVEIDDYTVRLLFEKDGCKVYMFTHRGVAGYYSQCNCK